MLIRKEDTRGFTLIELLIVIAIIGILTAIAVPAFMGQREKSKVRATEASAKSAGSDLQGFLDAYTSGEPYVMLIDSAGTQGCVEANNAIGLDKTCISAFGQASTATYATYPGGLTTIVSHFISHHTFKGDKSAFNGLPLYVTTSATDGQVLLSPSGSSTVFLLAYASNSTSPILSLLVSVR